MTRFVGGAASRHDALLSIRKGFVPDELREQLDAIGIQGVIQKKFIGRILSVVYKT
ncbi:MAG: hypothetical protein HQL11_02340 [Candidatus Omnitrophica bacterium]|nr:hypothetical protein [Candidatus Omnitrophota bacterium]